jgi:hypothetical protein
MKRMSRLMMTKSIYIEDMPISAFIDEMATAINTSSKHHVTPAGLNSVWKQKSDNSMRTKLQGLSRRKRGQWAAFAKFYFDLTFLPLLPLPVKKSKSNKDEDAEDAADVGEDNTLSSAVRLERFEAGTNFTINRTSLPNGTCCLSVTSTRRPVERYATHRVFMLSCLLLVRSRVEWTDSQLYVDMLGRTAKRIGLAVVCDSCDDGLMTMVSGVPKAFEAFVMMCVSAVNSDVCLSCSRYLGQGDKNFLPHKDSESRDFLAKHGITSIVVDELREHHTPVELSRFANSAENSCWHMFRMRKRFMDGVSGALFQGKSDSKARQTVDDQSEEDGDDDAAADEGDNESIVH